MKRPPIMFQRDPYVVNSTDAVSSFATAVRDTPLWSHILNVVGRHLREVGYAWTATFGTYTTDPRDNTIFTPSEAPLLYLNLVELEWMTSDVEAILYKKSLDDYTPWLFTSIEYQRTIMNTDVSNYINNLHAQKER